MSRPVITIIASLALIAGVTAAGVAYAHGYRGGPHDGPVHYGPGMHTPGMGYGFPHRAPGHGWRPDGEHRLMHFAGHLELSDEQREAVEEVFDRERSEKRQIRDSMRDNRHAMQETMRGKGYGSEFERLAERHGDLIADMIKLRARTFASIRDLLTDEQQERLRSGRDHDDFFGWH